MSLQVAQSVQITKVEEEQKSEVFVKPEQIFRESGEDELP